MLITELISAIETLPRNTWFQRNLLQIYLDRQNWKEAEQIADRCIAVDSTDAQTICVRGQLYEIRGEVENAMTQYLRSYALDSTQANVCSYIGRIHYNKAVALKSKLYDQRRFKQINRELQPIYNEALPWYERAYQYDTLHQDKTIPVAIREILYSRFTQDRCPNRSELIDQYNEVSRAYGLVEFGQ
jgi:tetratricopeptide (TPR) repeat protein